MLRTDKIGAIDYLIEASSKRRAAIKIICPLSRDNIQIVKRISQKAPQIEVLTSVSSTYSGLFIADGKKFMRFELEEPQAEEFIEAIGFGVYSNSGTGVESSRSFFELLWNEHIQQEKLKEYEELNEAEKLQREFVNIAAHELRTPIQPILD
jgi:signal transduction histidine kinase